MVKLTATNVTSVILDCLFKEDELDSSGKPSIPPVMVEGIVRNYGFNSDRLSSHTDDIVTMLYQLPKVFRKSVGGGGSFLEAALTKDGEQWGEHMNMEALFVLGMAINRVKMPLPREMWSFLPGGMPYFVFDDQEGDSK